ncbi:uncharacterized protein (TIGR03034 family) [Buttiauxella sp. JUb87]|uniref:DUF3289 family protein n=1 Tax=Buttiauxella sp. JUb87 TaxID=2485129 RepID=UPI00105EF80A|nr:DUF3289 family protein [Buttiauxella sp. JUb87]TDN54826.1 uncharacterized protein (TIGR03034 family) [Buttiauxella sp. JUb87]
MHISPPILLPRSTNELYSDWVMRCMPVDEDRNFPVNPVGAWHGGIHIPHSDMAPQANPVRAIAEGVIIYARYPSEQKDKAPLAYNGNTDDGCVLIRHEILIGEDPVPFNFYSLTMHMKQVRQEILSNIGKRIKREQVLGTSGSVDGKNAFHFQVFCDEKMLETFCGRVHGGVSVGEPARRKPVYGGDYYYFPAGTSVYGAIPRDLISTPLTLTSEAFYIINSSGDTKTLRKNDSGTYEYLGRVVIAVNYICEPQGIDLLKNNNGYSHWVKVAIPGSSGWVNVSDNKILTYSEADLPDWAGWMLVDDDVTVDSQCNSGIIKQLQSEVQKEGKNKDALTYSVCKFPFEWDFSTFDTRFSWVKTKTEQLPDPLNNDEYEELREHIKALCFYDKLSAKAQKELSGQLWHFEPRMFITQIQKAERRLIFETARKMNDFTDDDMRYGDMTKEEILSQGNIKKLTSFNFDISEDAHFDNMKSMAFLTAWGEYSKLINIMLDKFKQNEGGILKHDLINKAFLEHKTTKECISKIKSYIKKLLSDNQDGCFSKEDLKRLTSLIKNEVKLPKFDDWDWFNGLGIIIHDTYSTRIYLDYLIIKDEGFKAGLSFQIQDHFGLDVGDVNGKYFEYSSWFCSWFILQRFRDYGYKPFVNEANFNVVIEG